MKNAEEAKIQAEIVQYLQSKGRDFFSVANEGAGGNPVRMMQLVAMGLKAGVSDLVVFDDKEKVIFIEVKAPNGVQSKKQVGFAKICENYNLRYYIVRSVDDVKAIL